MSRLAVLVSPLRCSQLFMMQSVSWRRQLSSRRKGFDADGDYDPDFVEDERKAHGKPVEGNYTQDYSGDAKEGARLDGQKNFEGFPLAQQVGQYDYKHTPRPLRGKEFDYPLCEDTFGQRYPGYWIKGKFHYVKEMEPELIVPDLTDFPLKPYVSYRANEIEQPELTAKALFNLVYADDIYKRFLRGEDVEQKDDESVDKMIAEAEEARTRAEKTGSDRFVPDSWYGIEVDKFD